MTALQSFLTTPVLGTSAWLWLVFMAIVIGLLVLDLGVLHRHDREIEMRESLLLYSGYFSVGVLFGAGVWYQLGAQSALEFYTGFLVEQSLSMDNVFVMAMIFSYFAIPRRYQHRVLFWGILGVVFLRAIMIGVGAALVQNFAWVLYIFGAFLLFTGVKMALSKEDSRPDLANNPILKFVRRHMRVTDQIHGSHFFVRHTPAGHSKALRYATPLFLALVLIELADLVFAVDSVPADLRHHPGPVHRLHLQHLRHPRLTLAVFRAGGADAQVRLPQVRPGAGVDLHWLQDFLPRHGGQGAGAAVVGRDIRVVAGWGGDFVDQDAGADVE